MKRAMLMLTGLIASAGCDDGWTNEVTITASSKIDDGESFPTQVQVQPRQWLSLGHGDSNSRSVSAEIAVGGSATDLELTASGAGTYVVPPGAIDELHVQIDGVLLSKPMPTLIAQLTTPSPGAVATVLVTSADGDVVDVSVDGINSPTCGASSGDGRFEILPGCLPSPGRYRMNVSSSRVEGAWRDDLEATFDGPAYVHWTLRRYAHLTFDVP